MVSHMASLRSALALALRHRRVLEQPHARISAATVGAQQVRIVEMSVVSLGLSRKDVSKYEPAL